MLLIISLYTYIEIIELSFRKLAIWAGYDLGRVELTSLTASVNLIKLRICL
jgi:hypothetical protein